jgi:hypothetical protein
MVKVYKCILSACLGVLGHYDDHTRVSVVKPVQEVYNTPYIENLATTAMEEWKLVSSQAFYLFGILEESKLKLYNAFLPRFSCSITSKQC